MPRSHALALLLAPALMAQSQPTFYAAYQDGLEAEGRKDWPAAEGAYRRAIRLRPAPAAQIIIYGNNLLKDYYPYGRLARCQLELGHLDAASATLATPESHREPPSLREALLQRLREARAASGASGPKPVDAAASPTSEPALPKGPPAPAPALPTAIQTPPAPSLPAPDSNPARNPRPESAPQAPKPEPALAAQAEMAKGPEAPSVQAPLPGPPHRPWQAAWPVLSLAGAVLLGGTYWVYRRRKSGGDSDAFHEPKRFGPYRIERLLGRGGFASTYLARHEATGTPVALKVLHPYRMDDPEFLERFRQEARLGAMLDHPNLVRLTDPGPESGTPWLAMEYVAGQRLDQVLKKEGALPLPRLLGIAREIAEGLTHAHRLGVVHRDLKPGNVIFAGDHVKVMDFGISRIMDSQTLTTTYAFLGTPLYAAPEAQLKTHVGPAADRYAFGIMLFEMLAGFTPFSGETPFDILDKHRTNALPDLAPLRPDAPPALISLVEQLCRKDPDQRPQDEDILGVLAGLAS